MMAFLNVSYAEKDQVKAMGAKWGAAAKKWYVPIGVMLEPFERWVPGYGLAGAATSAPAKQVKDRVAPPKPVSERVDSYIGKTIVGASYLRHDHDCSPFDECEACKPVLEASGWAQARRGAGSL